MDTSPDTYTVPPTAHVDGSRETVHEGLQDLVPEITRALEVLGSTGNEVAATLRAAGVKGMRHRAGDCPVARYLQKAFDLPASLLAVADTHVGLAAASADVLRVMLPAPVTMFVIAFDFGRHPELEGAK